MTDELDSLMALETLACAWSYLQGILHGWRACRDAGALKGGVGLVRARERGYAAGGNVGTGTCRR